MSTVSVAIAAGATSVTLVSAGGFVDAGSVVDGTIVIGIGSNVEVLKLEPGLAAGNVLKLASTTLGVATAVGATTVTVADATGLEAKKSITIGTGANAETVEIEGVAGLVLTLATPLTKVHALNDVVTLAFKRAHAVNEPVTMLWQSIVFGFTSRIAAVAAGAMTVTVTNGNGAGFVPGPATIGEGATAETIEITSIAGDVLTLKDALANLHAATERVSMNWDDMATLGTGVATNYANKVASLTTPLAFAQAAGRVVQFGDIRLVGLYKLAPQAGAASPMS